MVKHFYVKFGDPSCIRFRDIVWKNRHIDVAENPTHVTTVGVGKYIRLDFRQEAQLSPRDLTVLDII